MPGCLDDSTALALLEGRLGAPARAAATRHLETCDACRELVAELARLDHDQPSAAPDTRRDVAPKLVAGQHVGAYVVTSVASSGASGTLYRARDESTGRVVALKHVEDGALRERFEREAAILARLDHPAIVRYLGHGDAPGGAYIAMEWLDGEDLASRLARGPLGWRGARIVGVRVAAALAHAHAHRCVHRDLGPRNVFLPGGRLHDAKLLDFGLARDGVIDRSSTASNAILGTPYYMAPEQIRDPSNVDGRADLFGLGVVLYECACGVRPFEGHDVFSLWQQIVEREPRDLHAIAPEVPERFARLVRLLLAKAPEARPETAEVVLRVLEGMDDDGGGWLQDAGPTVLPTVTMEPTTGQTVSMRPAPLPTSPPPAPYARAPMMPEVTPAALERPPPDEPERRSPSERPPPRRSGAYVIAGVVGLTAVVAASALVVARTNGGRANDDPRRGAGDTHDALDADDSRVAGDTDDHDEPGAAAPAPAVEAKATAALPTLLAAPPPTAPASPPTASASAAPPTSASDEPYEDVFFGGDVVVVQRGERYVPGAANADVTFAATAAGKARVTLEDCEIAGPKSLMVLGEAHVTLRRCRVLGAVSVIGANATLVLHETRLPKQPTLVGGAKVQVR